MNKLREQFEKECGWYPSEVDDRMDWRYIDEYREWLEQRIKAGQHETFVNRVMNVVICNDCKSYWIGKVQKCKCGCKTLTKTHKSNARYAINLE